MASWLHRARARWRLFRDVGLWYHPGYAPRALARTERVPSPAVERAERALDWVTAEGLLRPGDVREPAAASFETLGLVHTAEYLDSSSRDETLARIFALERGSFDVDSLLQAQRLAVGGTLDAVAAVRGRRIGVGVNLGGGFHHAEADRGAGFCVYNDVAVAVKRLRHAGCRGHIAVVDLDFHEGNGNLATLGEDGRVLLFSISGARWQHGGGLAGEQLVLPAASGDAAYLQLLRTTLPGLLQRHRTELVFFLAGSDVLAGDPLGTFLLTPQGVLDRDRFVVECARDIGAGVVVTLAGGYGPNAWCCTANLLRFLLCGVTRAIPAVAEQHSFAPRVKYAEPAEFPDESSFEEEVAAQLGWGTPRLLLDTYTAHGVEHALERFGVLEEVRAHGYRAVRVTLDVRDRERQLVRLRGSKGGAGALSVVLMELVVGRRHVSLPVPDGEGPLELLGVEWLLLQDPDASFSLERPPLPGQEHPGLGVAGEVKDLMVQLCRNQGLDGILERPSHYHNALGAGPEFRFLEPDEEARFRAFKEALSGCDLAVASRLIERGDLQDAAGRPVLWKAAAHVLPVSDRLRRYFESPGYRQALEAASATWATLGLHVRSAAA